MSRIFKAVPIGGEPAADARRRPTAGDEPGTRKLEEEARVRAAELIDGARRRAEAMRAEGHRQGIAEGFEAGYAVGLKQGLAQAQVDARAAVQADTAALTSALRSLLAALETRREAFASRIHRDLVELALRIAEKVVQAQVAVDPAVALRNCRRAIELTVRKSDVEIHVNPRDWDRVAEYLPALQSELSHLTAASIKADDAVAPGGCRLESSEGMVDADLAAQMDVIRRTLLPDGAPAPRGSFAAEPAGPPRPGGPRA